MYFLIFFYPLPVLKGVSVAPPICAFPEIPPFFFLKSEAGACQCQGLPCHCIQRETRGQRHHRQLHCSVTGKLAFLQTKALQTVFYISFTIVLHKTPKRSCSGNTQWLLYATETANVALEMIMLLPNFLTGRLNCFCLWTPLPTWPHCNHIVHLVKCYL